MSGSRRLYGFVGNERDRSFCFHCVLQLEGLKHPRQSRAELPARRGLGKDGCAGEGWDAGAMPGQTGSPQGSLLTRHLVTGECLLVTPAPSPPPVATAAPPAPSRETGAPGLGRWALIFKPKYPLIQGTRDCFECYRAECRDRIMCCVCKCCFIQVGTILHFFSCCRK